MCGIIGLLDKRPQQGQPLGRTLLTMLQALSCRGPDSAGVALFGPPAEWHLRLSVAAGLEAEILATELRALGATSVRDYGNGVHDVLLSSGADLLTLEEQIERCLPGTEIICLGRWLN